MILIADSGSTKTSWLLVTDKSSFVKVHTQGFNPYFQSSATIEKAIRTELSEEILSQAGNKNLSVFYYGAGCSSPEKSGVVREALESIFKEARIAVDHDLLASARALCGNQPAIACILGTGSNSCYYDGKEIKENVPSLGYFFGDHGSGGHIGKTLLQAFFNGELPRDLHAEFAAMPEFDREYILENIYKKPMPNRFLASYGKIAGKYVHHTYIRGLLRNCFQDFLDHQVVKYKLYRELPINFVGSVAFSNKEILNEVLEENGLRTGIIAQSPMEGLMRFHATGAPFQ
jgi:glucosamine kinase